MGLLSGSWFGGLGFEVGWLVLGPGCWGLLGYATEQAPQVGGKGGWHGGGGGLRVR